MNKAPFFIQYYKTILLLSSIAIFAVCCKSTHTVTSVATTTTTSNSSTADPLAPVEADLAIAKAHWPATTLDNLKQGYAIYDDKCTDCHDTKRPQDFTVDEWYSIMPKMGRKAHLDSIQYKMVFHYILTKREAILGSGK